MVVPIRISCQESSVGMPFKKRQDAKSGGGEKSRLPFPKAMVPREVTSCAKHMYFNIKPSIQSDGDHISK